MTTADASPSNNGTGLGSVVSVLDASAARPS